MWEFRKITSIEEAIFNNTLERFYNNGIDGLVRENIQNSLDGKLKDSSLPVEVIIKTGTMRPEQVPGIEEAKAHIAALHGMNVYTKETIEHMQASMNKSSVPYISFEDRNTKGLTGAKRGELFKEGDTWGVYAYKKGVHFTESDSAEEEIRGGSHGIGKIACNAASDLYMMFFCNCDKEDNQHIGGTIQLIEHCLNGVNYRATGYFTKVDSQDHYFPYENKFDLVFRKDTRGLKIVIPYLRQQFQGTNGIIRAVCDNFFVAILNRKLVVEVNGTIIDDQSIRDFVSDSDIYPEQEYEEMKNSFTPLYLQTYCSANPDVIEVEDLSTSHYFRLYFTMDEHIKRGRMAIVRGIGMKIEDKKISSYVNAPYNAVLIPLTSQEDAFLKSLENESHTQLACEHIKDPVKQANAKRFINNITRRMQEVIAGVLSEANKADGVIDTSDVIYSMEANFRKELSKSITTVQLSKGEEGNGTTVVKTKTASGTKAEKKKKEKKKEKKKKERKLKDLIHKITGSDSGSDGKDQSSKRYSMHPEAVKRIVLGRQNKEMLAFDFREVEQYEGETKCDISLTVIDGTGAARENEFNLNSNYALVEDKLASHACHVKGNTIRDVAIVDGKVQLEMKTTADCNESLKFMYYVEVRP